ncbi:MAG: sigma-70 family RNA polymerase sigma factor [Microbacteriaceae bacterium]
MRAAVESSDAELITLAREGDTSALGAIFGRHSAAVTAVARAHARDPIAADDLVAEAFARTYRVLRAGGGPDVALRAYLYTAVRRLAAERARAEAKARSAGLFEELDRPAPTSDAQLDDFEREVIGKAYLALPERWRAVLWHVEVERMSPAAVAPILGLSASGVSALAYRAREGLREQYLQQHVGSLDAAEPQCREVATLLGSYARGRAARRDRKRVEEHLRGCARCARVVAELRDASHGLRTVVAPLVLGVAGVGALPALVGGEAAAASVPGAGVSVPGASVSVPPIRRADAGSGASAAASGTGGSAASGTAPAPAPQGLGVPAVVLALTLGLGVIGFGTYAAVRAVEGGPATVEAAPSASASAAATAPAGDASADPAAAEQPAASGPARLTVAVRTTEALRPGVAGELLIELGNAGGGSGEVVVRATLPAGVVLDPARAAGAEGWACSAEGDAVACTAAGVAGSSTSRLALPVAVATDAPAALPIRVAVHESGTLAAVDEADAADPASASVR